MSPSTIQPATASVASPQVRLELAQVGRKGVVGGLPTGVEARISIEVYGTKPSKVVIEGFVKGRYIPEIKRAINKAWWNWKGAEAARREGKPLPTRSVNVESAKGGESHEVGGEGNE